MVNDADAAIKVPAADGKMRLWRNTRVATQSTGATATLAPSTLGYEFDEDLDNGFRRRGSFRSVDHRPAPSTSICRTTAAHGARGPRPTT